MQIQDGKWFGDGTSPLCGTRANRAVTDAELLQELTAKGMVVPTGMNAWEVIRREIRKVYPAEFAFGPLSIMPVDKRSNNRYTGSFRVANDRVSTLLLSPGVACHLLPHLNGAPPDGRVRSPMVTFITMDAETEMVIAALVVYA